MLINCTEELQQTRFDWDEYQQNFMLGCFFWGYLCTELPGGRLAEIIGARRVFGYSMLAASIITVVTPAAANLSYIAVIILRVLLGLMLVKPWQGIDGICGNANDMVEDRGPHTHPQQCRQQTLTYSGEAISVQQVRLARQTLSLPYPSTYSTGCDVACHPPHDRSLDPTHGAESVHFQHDG
uniref:Major facilitator superfamily (MFS) profile domain-containing protein n=1 Tax=Timema bartmani TaxID=61472 RepID=A0A7R9F781_9NEOP|nr:unnamed protein product [Timema bartmani]